MKRTYWLAIGIIAVTLTLAIALPQASSASSNATPWQVPSPTPTPEPQYKEGELLVKFSPNVTSTAKQAAHTNVGATVLRDFSFIGWQHLQLPTGMSVSQAMTTYKAISGVVAAEPNYELKLAAVPNDPKFDLQYGLQKIQAPGAWDITTGSSSVVLAVLDTGVNYNHPDLAANMWHNPGETPGNNIDDDNNGYVDDVYGIDPSNLDSDPIDDSGHGTTCAGVLGAAGNNSTGVTGTNWTVKIMAIKIFFNTGTGFVAEAIAAFDYVTMMRNRGINIRATSNSWRWWFGQFSQSVKDAIDAAGNAGVVNVFASGNDFVFETRCTPAGCRELHATDLDFQPTYGAAWDSPSIISVASSNANDNLSVFAGYGRKTVDLSAPGENIWTTTIDGNYGLSSGTSMSTPFVAGSVGLLTADDTSLSVASLKATLLNTVDTFADHEGKMVSGGRLNVLRALQQTTVCTFTASPASQKVTANAGTGRIDVTSGTNCGFAGKTTSSFITITSGAGTGNGSVEFSFPENTTGSNRTGTITVGGETVEVTQAAAAPEGCVTLTPTSENFSAAGGQGTVDVTAGQGCSFVADAQSNDFWITDVSVGLNDVVSYTVEPNLGPPRTGTILISGKVFTVTQSSGCTFEFSPEAQSHQAIGASGRLKVYASDPRCTWTPESDQEWLSINLVISGGNFGLSAVGDGLIQFTVDPNFDGVDRTANIDIGDQTYSVTQGHCNYSFTPGQAFIPTSGSSGSFTITTTSGCPWAVSSVYDWIHITSTASGTGSTTVNYTVDENHTAQYRSGVIYVAQQFPSTAVINSTQFVKIDQDSHLPGKIAFSTNADGDYEIYVMNNDGSNQTRLTNNTAYDDAAAWSPDGSKIAFVSDRDGQLNIYVMNADGSNQTRLTTTSSSDVYPVWSPDGTKIAFQSFRDGNSEIYVMNADGTSQTRLTNNSSGDYFPSWSPNGAQLTFSSNRTGVLNVHTMNADGSNQVALTISGISHAPAWSPDGRWIAFMHDATSSGTFIISIYDTIFQSTIPVSSGNDFFPQWSPDSSKLIFTTTRDGNNEIYYVRNFDGLGPVRLTNASSTETKPAWQPVPAKIAFTTDRDGNQEVYLMNPDGTNPINLTNDAGTDSSPTWSPDGMKVAFVSTRSGSQSQDIFVINADGTNTSNLTNSVGSDVSPAWSPDGSKIAFASYRDGNSEIYMMNADGTSATRLTNNSAYDSSPAWSPDGTKIAFATNRDGVLQIYTMNADGSSQTRLSNTTANDHFPAWSPDGAKILFASDRSGSFQIYVMNADGTNQTRLTNTAAGFDFYPQWSSPDGAKIVFSSSRDGNNEIYVMKADGSGPTNLSANAAYDYGPAWRPQ